MKTYLIDYVSPSGRIASARLEAHDWADAERRLTCLLETARGVAGELIEEITLDFSSGPIVTQVGNA